MDARLRSSLLWGVVGALTFLVLLQGYELLTTRSVTVPVKAGTAALVLAGATLLTYLADGGPPPNERT